VDLPRVPSQPLPPTDKEPVIVSVDHAGRFFINYGDNQDKPVDAQTLVNRVSALRKYQPKIPFFVKGDSQVPYGRVVQAMALLQAAGVNGVGLVTKPPEH